MTICTAANYVTIKYISINTKNGTTLYKHLSCLAKYYSTKFNKTHPSITMVSNSDKIDKESSHTNQIGVEKDLLTKRKENIYRVKQCAEDMLREGQNVPRAISTKKIEKLLDLESSKVPNMLQRWAVVEKKRQNTRHNMNKRNRMKSELYTNIDYGLWQNSMFIRFKPSSINRFYRCNLANKYRLSNPIVFDCGFQLNEKMIANMVVDLSKFYFYNRTFPDPFNIYLANVSPKLREVLYKHNMNIPMVEDIHITEESYLNLFPHNKLVYLSPDAKKILDHVDDDAIYIIGGVYESMLPLSLAKSRSDEIKSYSLPLSKHLSIAEERALPPHVIGQILLHYNREPHSTWADAFSCVPEDFCQLGTHTQKMYPYPKLIR